jgi:general secretion pathway protein J
MKIKLNFQGFTLVEILVAMVIFSLTLVTLFSSFNAFLSSGSLVKEEVNQNECCRTGIKTIISDLDQIFVLPPPRYSKPEFDSEPDLYRFEGELVNLGGEQFSQLSFSSLNHLELGGYPGKGVAKIIYHVVIRENNSDSIQYGQVQYDQVRYDLVRSDNLAPYPDGGDPCSDPILFKDILGFKLTYTDINGDEHETWDSESEEFGFIFPVNVHLWVELKTKGKATPIMTALTLPINRKVIK